jgi:flagellar biosynthesis protein FlhF
MHMRRFRASAMAEAMSHVRAELGPDALILHTRHLPDGVEVEAALQSLPDTPPPVRIAEALAWHGIPPALSMALQCDDLAGALAAQLRFSPLPLSAGSPPLLLTGPVAGGRTLTTARLATRLVLAGTPPLVVVADGSRAGAVGRLAHHTRTLGIDLRVASSDATLQRALEPATDAPVLIDGPACNPFDATQILALETLAAAAGAQTALVLPAGLDAVEAEEMARAYGRAGARWLVATRIDLARRLGSVVTAAHDTGLGLAEAGVGIGATDGLIPLTPAWLADRLRHTPLAPAASPALH